MEPHPVPQDILNVEFKLFGAFTLRQFGYILIGCLVALGIFITPLPFLIKLPMVFMAIGNGIAMAIIPRWGAKMEGFVKSVFISPRYVWIRESQTPDSLKRRGTMAKKKTSSRNKSNSRNQKIDLEEISLEEMLGARQTRPRAANANEQIPRDKFDELPREKNLDRIMGELYKTHPDMASVKPSGQATPATGLTANTQGGNSKVVRKQIDTKQDLVKEINNLKMQLGYIVKDQHYKEKEAEILANINDLYHELKMMGLESSVQSRLPNVDPNKIQNFQGTPQTEHLGQIIFGVVVDKNDIPVTNAEVYFDLKNSDNDLLVRTDSKGQFNSNKKILPGVYDISIRHPQHRFHTYAITVSDGKLPAYKLRAK